MKAAQWLQHFDRLAAASLQRPNQPAADSTSEAQRAHARFHLQYLPRLTTRPEHIKAMRQTFYNLAFHRRDAGPGLWRLSHILITLQSGKG